MNQQDQYQADVEALAGTGKEAWTLWKTRRKEALDHIFWPIICAPNFKSKFNEYCRITNADNLILQAQYEADMAVNPRAWEWWETYHEDYEEYRGWWPFRHEISIGFWENSDVRRKLDAPSRTEWAREHECELLKPDLESIPDIFQSSELYQCPYDEICRCNLKDPCLGCEAFEEWRLKFKNKPCRDKFVTGLELLENMLENAMTQDGFEDEHAIGLCRKVEDFIVGHGKERRYFPHNSLIDNA